MSFSGEYTFPRSTIEAFLDGKAAFAFEEDQDVYSFEEGEMIDDLDVYENAIIRQTNGEHTEDVYDAGICLASDFTEREDIVMTTGHYDGSYAGRDALCLSMYEEYGNGHVILYVMEDPDDPDMGVIVADLS